MAAGLLPVKINTVLLRGVNDHEAYPLLEWAMRTGVQLRFIEQMPLDAQHAWKRTEMVTADEIRERLSAHVTLVEDDRDRARRGSAPAELFRVRATGTPSASSPSVTKPFGACDRVRLTADGQLRNCLFARTSPTCGPAADRGQRRGDRGPLGAGRGRQTSRPRHHDPSFLQPDRPMSAIGG